MKPEHWDWTPHQAAPTPRTVTVHAWQWLMCDRQHIDHPDIAAHQDVLEPPEDPEEFCQAFEAEIEQWRHLLRRLTPEDLLQTRPQFNHPGGELNVRFYIGHMLQNVIYKHGQFAVAFFALGYDGLEPYEAPFPNPIYAEMRRSCEPEPTR